MARFEQWNALNRIRAPDNRTRKHSAFQPLLFSGSISGNASGNAPTAVNPIPNHAHGLVGGVTLTASGSWFALVSKWILSKRRALSSDTPPFSPSQA